MTPSTILTLPKPILLNHVLPHLNTKSLLNLSETCDFLNSLIKSDKIWREIANKIDFQIPEDTESIYLLVTNHLKETPLRIGKYDYYRGAGCRTNRKIDFFRTGSNPDTFQAKVSAMQCGKWCYISPDLGDNIFVKMQFASEKIKIMMDQRKKDGWHPIGSEPAPYVPDKKMNELSLAKQNNILDNLNNIKDYLKTGQWSISVTTDIGSSPYFENIVRLNFYTED